MTTYSSSKVIKTLWSACSYDAFSELLNDPKALSCLKTTVPNTIYSHAICGNGIREGSEQCDCGSVVVSSSPVHVMPWCICQYVCIWSRLITHSASTY